jgi:Cytochrome c554 and c-prime
VTDLVAVVVTALALAACGGCDEPRHTAAVVDAATAAPVSVLRCSECHEKMYKEWRTSAHAASTTSPLYRAMLQQVPSAAVCDGCHAPLASRVAPADPPAAHGVACDVCHSLRAVEPARAGAQLVLLVDDNVKFGPLCDAKDNYFHRTACSPLHTTAKLCGGCHLWYWGELPVFTEYEEWSAGPWAAEGVTCQQCHMPATAAEAAAGSGVRAKVRNHSFFGDKPDFRKRALKARVSVASAGGRVKVEIALRNERAGHAVPSGLPERRLLVKVVALDATGVTIDHAERSYGRRLVDAAGAPAPFFRAAKVASDDRIAPRETRSETLDLKTPPAGALQITVSWQAIDPAIARLVAVEKPEEIVLLEGKIAIKGKTFTPKVLELGR